MESCQDISGNSLNIEKKMPRPLSKFLAPMILLDRELVSLKKEGPPGGPNSDESKIEAKQANARMAFENKRKGRLSGARKSPAHEEEKHKNGGGALPHFGASLFRILKFIRKRALYRSYKNLKEHHYQILNDRAIMLPDSAAHKTKRNFHSIWDDNASGSVNPGGFWPSFVSFFKKCPSKWKDSSSRTAKCLQAMPLIDPNHLGKILWDLLVFLCLMLKLFLYSLDRGFVHVNSLKTLGDMLNYNILLFILLLLDLLLSLNTKIYISGNCVSERPKILWNYIKKYAVIDFFSLLQVLFSCTEKEFTNHLDLNLILLPRLIFCNPDLSGRLRGLLVKNNENVEGIYSIMSLGVKILISGHIMACLWHLTSHNYSEAHPVGNSWIKDKGLFEAQWQTKYLYSIYWGVTTMLTVGYGDITPQNEDEVFMTICSMLSSCVIFGYCLNRIGEIIKRASKYQKNLKKKREQLLKMSQRMNLSKELQTKILKYLEFVQDQEVKANPEVERSIMSKLSHSLRDEVHRETRVKQLRNVILFNKILSEQSLLELSRRLEEKRYMPEETIFRENQKDDSLYIVLEGEVDISPDPLRKDDLSSTKYESCAEKDYFGLQEFFTAAPRKGRAVTRNFTTLLKVKREDFIEVIKRNAEEYEKFCFVRENIIVYGNPTQLQIKCSSCGRLEHRTLECPFLSYSPNKMLVIGRYVEKKKKRNQLKRVARKYHSLMNNKNTVKSLLELRTSLEADEEFAELKRKYAQVEKEAAELPEARDIKDGKESCLVENPGASELNPPPEDLAFATKATKSIRSSKSMKREDTLFTNKIQLEKKTTSYGRDATLTRSKKETNELLFYQTDSIKNFRFFFPRNNAELVLRKLQAKKFFEHFLK